MTHHETEPSRDSFGTLVTFACGAIVGAAAALILAPASGRDSRAALAERGRRAVDKGRDVLRDQTARVTSAIEHGREQIHALGERLDHAVEAGKAGYREARAHGRELASSVPAQTESLSTVRAATEARDQFR
jgi:gas vesicle protein